MYLQSSMLSVLNVAGTYSFNAQLDAWTFHLEGGRTLTYYAKDVIVLFERCGHSEFNDYYESYRKFHSELLSRFQDEYLVYFVLLVIDLFSPHRFKQDFDMLCYLVPAHSRFVQFLEFYLLFNYDEQGVQRAQAQGQGAKGEHSFPGSTCPGFSGSGLTEPHSTTSPEPSDRSDRSGPCATSVYSSDQSDREQGDPSAPARKRVRLVSKELFDFCMRKLNDARALEEFLAITTSRIGLTQMLPLLAEICAASTL